MSKFAPLSYFDLSELFSKSMFSITKRANSLTQANGTYHKPGCSSVYSLYVHCTNVASSKLPID